MKKIIAFICFPLWVDFERLFRKSKGIKGYIGSLAFYWQIYKDFNLPGGKYYKGGVER